MRKVNVLMSGFAVATICTFSSCGESATNEEAKSTSETTTEVSETEVVQEAEWEKYTNEEEGFEVMMPEITEPTKIEAGGIISYSLVHQPEDDESYMVNYSEMLDTNPDEIDGPIAESMIKGAKLGSTAVLDMYGGETVTDEEKAFKYLDKYFALRFRGHNGDQNISSLYFIKGTKLFQVWASYKESEANQKKVDKFFNSFKLLDK